MTRSENEAPNGAVQDKIGFSIRRAENGILRILDLPRRTHRYIVRHAERVRDMLNNSVYAAPHRSCTHGARGAYHQRPALHTEDV
jgi:hypothetical protein